MISVISTSSVATIMIVFLEFGFSHLFFLFSNFTNSFKVVSSKEFSVTQFRKVSTIFKPDSVTFSVTSSVVSVMISVISASSVATISVVFSEFFLSDFGTFILVNKIKFVTEEFLLR